MEEKVDIKTLFENTLKEVKKIDEAEGPLVGYALHKMGDGFEDEEQVKDCADDTYYIFFLLSDGHGNFRFVRGYTWDELQEEYNEDGEFNEVYYGYFDDDAASKSALNLANYDWPSEDYDVVDGIKCTINDEVEDLFGSYAHFPPIEVKFYYNEEIVLELTL